MAASRNTVQRSIIEAELRRLANHPTADEVYDAVHGSYPTIGRATVFRTLSKLADEGTIARVRINNGADRFDHQTFAHYHVRCTCCGKVDDVIMAPVADVNQTAAAATGYVGVGHSLQFDGICPDCQASRATTA